jgi:hypothetical protein
MAPRVYAAHLVDTARALGLRQLPRGALPLVRGVGLRNRVRAILGDSSRAPLPAPTLLRWAVLTVLATAAFGSANLWMCETESDSPARALVAPAAPAPPGITT